jgi:hypothetical protein
MTSAAQLLSGAIGFLVHLPQAHHAFQDHLQVPAFSFPNSRVQAIYLPLQKVGVLAWEAMGRKLGGQDRE